MKQYERFIIDSYEYNQGSQSISLHYSLDSEIAFTETLHLPDGANAHISEAEIHQSLLALLMAGGPSYYKTCLPSSIDVNHPLSKEQKKFWKTVYEHGLGEFFYRNEIDFRDRININALSPHNTDLVEESSKPKRETPRVLVPIGGGKDSMVTIELLRKQGVDITLLRVGSHPMIDSIAELAGLPILNIKRSLSPELFALNEEGALNGHVPITAYISALSIVLAQLYDFDAVAFSNERSADYGNIEYLGMTINHQWSKSLDFEQSFQKYVHQHISPDIDYFSALRPLSELHIAKLFCQYEEYIGSCTSCNKNWRILKEKPDEKWCGTCPKCAFVFSMLSAFLPVEQLTHIFNGSPYENESMLALYKQLLGKEGFKPFECVGTPEESIAAFLLTHEKGDMNDTVIMQWFEKEILPTINNKEELVSNAFTPADEHCIPKAYLPDYQ